MLLLNVMLDGITLLQRFQFVGEQWIRDARGGGVAREGLVASHMLQFGIGGSGVFRMVAHPHENETRD
jgi:hypothetical protein